MAQVQKRHKFPTLSAGLATQPAAFKPSLGCRKGLMRDLPPSAQEAVCLPPPSMALRLLMPRSTCRPAAVAFRPFFLGFPVAEVARGWSVNAALSMHTLDQDVTAPGLGTNCTLRSQWAPESWERPGSGSGHPRTGTGGPSWH